MHAHVATLGQVRLTASALDLLLAQAVHLFQASLQLLLNGEADFDGDGRHNFQEQLTHGAVYLRPGYPLAHRLRIVDAAPVTEIVGHADSGPHMINHLHALATDAANRQTL